MKRIVHVLESEGGFSRAEKDAIDRMAHVLVMSDVEESGDKAAYCGEAVDLINTGQLDLHRMEHSAVPLARVMGERS